MALAVRRGGGVPPIFIEIVFGRSTRVAVGLVEETGGHVVGIKTNGRRGGEKRQDRHLSLFF